MDCVSVAGMLLQKSGDRRPLRKHWSVHIMGLLDHIAVLQYGSGEVTRVNLNFHFLLGPRLLESLATRAI